MVFSSALFLFLFLPLTLIAYWVAPRAARNGILLATSLLFYAWGSPAALVWMLVSISLNHALGLQLAHSAGWRATPRGRGLILGAAIVLNLGLLMWFKYAGFLYEQARVALLCGIEWPVWTAPPILPIGISFYTFQALSYVVDVYRGEVAAQRSWSQLALYIAFFPQLVAGPIVRYADFARDLIQRTVTIDSAANGVRRILVGLCKKLLLADSLAACVDVIFELPDDGVTPALARLALVCYTLQIYFDFSGYSDMAIGLGQLFGFTFPENFRYPYIATSVTDFWRRWHLSLSTWFRDYLYIPLGGNRGGRLSTCRNLLVVFVLCGFWHGANWTFVAWGLFHGLFLASERLLARNTESAPPGLAAAMLGRAYTLLVVMTGWALFRSDDLPQAVRFLATAAGQYAGDAVAYPLAQYLDGPLVAVMAVSVLAATPWPAEWMARIGTWSDEQLARNNAARNNLASRLVRWGAWGWWGVRAALPAMALVLVSILFAAASYSPFIYFRF
jgi:alginate O-acetyltransferase complex protein AlgI